MFSLFALLLLLLLLLLFSIDTEHADSFLMISNISETDNTLHFL
jgi:hypothetical protein